jgi:DNA helicase HerA-like ATPase
MHTIISGVTESGKTTLARMLARNFAGQGQNVIVYDPVGTGTLGGGWPESAVVFSDEEEFLSYVARDDVTHSHVFIDEAGDVFNLSKRHNMWLLTRGRHFGLYCYLICQRPKMVAPSARSQCSRAYMFRLAHEDASEISRDFGHSWPYKTQKNIPEKELDKGDFFVLYSGSVNKSRANIFSLLNSKGRTP